MLNNISEDIILDAALDVIDEFSIAHTSLTKIASQAGMSQPNLYYYFNTKHDLLVRLVMRMQDYYNELMRRFTKDRLSFRDKIHGFFDQKVFLIREDPRYETAQFDLWIMSRDDKEIEELFAKSYLIWRKRISDCIKDELPHLSDGACNIYAGIIVSMQVGGSFQYLSNPDSYDLDEYFETCLNMVMAMLLPLKAQTQPDEKRTGS